MANGRDINIDIQTTADTSGAESAADSIADVREATEAANESAEANIESIRETREETDALMQTEAQREDAARAADVAQDVRRIRNLQYAQAMNMLSQTLGRAADGLRRYSEEIAKIDPGTAEQIEGVAEAFGAVESSANAAALGMQVAGPKGAVAFAILAPAIGKLREEVDGAVRSLANLRQIEEIGRNLPATMEKVRDARAAEAQLAAWQKWRQEVTETESVLLRINNANEARRGLDEFRAAQLVELERVRGGDVAGAEANLQNVQDANFAARQSEAMTEAEAKAANTLKEYEFALGLRIKGLENLTESERKVVAQLRELDDAAANARRDVNDLVSAQMTERRQREFGSNVGGEIAQIQATNAAESTTVESINALVEAIPPEADANLRRAAEYLASYTKDGELTAEEMANTTAILQRFANQIRDLGAEQNAALRDAISDVENLKTELRALKLNTTNGIR